jgi:hypothetical protein
MSDHYQVEYDEERKLWKVTDGDVAYSHTDIEQEAYAQMHALNNCKHEDLERPEWDGGDNLNGPNDIVIHCSFCAAHAYIPIPSNLEWSHE